MLTSVNIARPGEAVPVEQIAQLPRSQKRPLQMQFVEPPHRRQVVLRRRHRRVLRRPPRQSEQLTLPHHRQRVFGIDRRFALPNPVLLSAPSKNSHSIVSCPIFACNARIVAAA